MTTGTFPFNLQSGFELLSLFSEWSRREPLEKLRQGKHDIRVGLIGAGSIGQVHTGKMSKTILERFRLEGRVALITGAGQGIGKAFAYALEEAGAKVAIADVRAELADKVIEGGQTLW